MCSPQIYVSLHSDTLSSLSANKFVLLILPLKAMYLIEKQQPNLFYGIWLVPSSDETNHIYNNLVGNSDHHTAETA